MTTDVQPVGPSPAARACLLLSALAAATLIIGLIAARPTVWQPAAIALVVSLPFTLRGIPKLRGYQFTAWIIAAVTSAMIAPERFLRVGPVALNDKGILLAIVQLVMFGMGTRMSIRDFVGVIRTPWTVFVGILCHFTIMPLIGFTLTKIIPLPDEIAAGVILIGCCSSGLASNVMAHLAGADLPLSVTITSVTTLMAPVMTPMWMKVLAGDKVNVNFIDMMAHIINVVVVPIGAALLHDYLKFATPRGRRVVGVIAAIAAAWLVFLFTGGWGWFASHLIDGALLGVTIASFLLGAVLAGVLYHALVRVAPGIERWMPVASMFGIVYFTAVTTAVGRDNLLKVGGLLFLAAVIHNALGYVLGYWSSRGLGVGRSSARTVAFEVGLQNGGMASSIAADMKMLGTMGLPAAVFSPWMNISGSILANYWSKRPADAKEEVSDASVEPVGCEPVDQRG